MASFLLISQTVPCTGWVYSDGLIVLRYSIGLCKVLSNTLPFSNRDVYSSIIYFPLLTNISRQGRHLTINKAPSFCQLDSSCRLGSVSSLDSQHPNACSWAFKAEFTRKPDSHRWLLNKTCYGNHNCAFLQVWLTAASRAFKQSPCSMLTLSLMGFRWVALTPWQPAHSFLSEVTALSTVTALIKALRSQFLVLSGCFLLVFHLDTRVHLQGLFIWHVSHWLMLIRLRVRTKYLKRGCDSDVQ